jgi:hypothetical protein
MLINRLKILIALILLSAPFQSGLASPGAAVPWITYYSGKMSTNGTRMGPGYQPFTVEAESAERTCIKLSETGQYVELTAREWANALVVRYSIPDTPAGGGFDSTISVYKNGVFVQKLSVTSKYSWLYGFYSWTNNPSDGFTRNFYNEARLLGLNVAPNDRVTTWLHTTSPAPFQATWVYTTSQFKVRVCGTPTWLEILTYIPISTGGYA